MRIVIHIGHCLSFRFSSFVSQLMLHDCLTMIDQMPCSASQDSRVEAPSMLAAVRTRDDCDVWFAIPACLFVPSAVLLGTLTIRGPTNSGIGAPRLGTKTYVEPHPSMPFGRSSGKHDGYLNSSPASMPPVG